MQDVKLGTHVIEDGQPPYIIAEIGSNHNGDMSLCRKLIDSAAEAGVQAVKFQSWSERSLISSEQYDLNTDYSDKKKHFGTLREMVRSYQFTPRQHREIAAYCRDRGVAFSSTPFSESEVDLLEELDVPFLKIASMDINNLTLLQYAAATNKPMLISTGMASMAEIDQALDVVREAGNDRIVLLHCVSLYPPVVQDMNLRNIPMLRQAFGVHTGFSDHSLGTAVPLTAIALGACVVEKHFTLDKDLEGWDHAMSADPVELAHIVSGGRDVVAALGSTVRTVTASEREKRRSFRRSLVLRTALPEGHILSPDDLTAKRPGTGVAPSDLRCVIGRRLSRALEEDAVLHWDHLA